MFSRLSKFAVLGGAGSECVRIREEERGGALGIISLGNMMFRHAFVSIK